MKHERSTPIGRSLSKTRRLLLAAALCPMLALPAMAQEKFPSRSLEFIVPYAPGGSADFVSRLVADQMSKILGQQVVIMNKAGAGGQIGFSAIAKAKPDGYTFGLAPAAFLHLPAIADNLPYDTLKDFDYITRMIDMSFVLTVSAKTPQHTLTDVIAFGKKNPGVLNYGHYGRGTSSDILGAMFAKDAGIQATSVPFQSTAQLTPQRISGAIQLGFDLIVSQLPFIKSSQYVPLFVTSPTRYPGLPNTPTAAEAGYPNLEYATWFGLIAPKGIPADALAALNKATIAALRDPEVQAKLQQQGMDVKTDTPDEFRRFAVVYKEKIRKVVQENAEGSKK